MPRPLAAPILALCAAGCSTGPSSPGRTPSPAPVLGPAAPDEAWSAAFVRTDGWTGADVAATVPLPGSRTLWLFGDSWIGPVRDHRHATGSTMVNNTIAVQNLRPTASRPPSPLAFSWNNTDPAHPAAWAVPEQPSQWFWPAGGGITTSEPHQRLLLFMSRIARRDWSDSVWNFTFRGTSLLIISNPGDAPDHWRVALYTISALDPDHPRELIWGAAVLADPDDPSHVLIYGIDSKDPLDRSLLLARAPTVSVERAETWAYFSGRESGGRAGWSRSLSDAAPIATGLAPELSIHFLPAMHAYVMVHSEPPLGRGVQARTAPRPEGPWSDPLSLYRAPDTDREALTYAAKAHPELSGPDSLLITYCANSTDFWYMASHAEMYLPRAIRSPIVEPGRSFGGDSQGRAP